MKTDNKYLIAFTAMLGTLMEVVDTSVANVALPHMQGTYSAGVDEITWVITSYLVANAVILPITGWLGNHFGRRRFYLFCLVAFTLDSLGSGAAPSLWFLILMRVIQVLAGGAMVPMSQAILLESFPKEEHPRDGARTRMSTRPRAARVGDRGRCLRPPTGSSTRESGDCPSPLFRTGPRYRSNQSSYSLIISVRGTE